MHGISAADPASAVVVRVMVRAREAQVSVKGPARVVVGQVLAADLVTMVGRLTVMDLVVPAMDVAVDMVPAPVLWVRVMVRVSQVMVVILAPVVDLALVPAPWVRVTVRVFQVMANRDENAKQAELASAPEPTEMSA